MAAAAERPNIVFVMADDMPGRLWSTMPALRDRVGAQGVRFRNAYVTQSLCCPSRATVLTGKYPHNHGITGNESPNGGEPEFRSTGQDLDTVATRVRAAGYRTALIGKYMNGYTGEYVPPGWSYWYAQSGGPSTRTANENGRIVDYSGSFPDDHSEQGPGLLEPCHGPGRRSALHALLLDHPAAPAHELTTGLRRPLPKRQATTPALV